MKKSKKKKQSILAILLDINPFAVLVGIIVLFVVGWLVVSMMARAAPTDAPEHVITWGSFGSAEGQFGVSEYFAVGEDGKIYLTDKLSNKVQVFDDVGNYVSSFGSSGSGDGQFTNPTGIAIDTVNDKIYVADDTLRNVQVFDLNGTYLNKWSVSPYYHPQAVAVDEKSGDVFISVSSSTLLTNNNLIAIYNSSGEVQTTFGGSGSGDGQFSGLKDLFIHDFELFTVDRTNNRVQVFAFTGDFIRKFGTSGSEDGQFNNPLGIFVDANDYIYVADDNNFRIQKFDINGNYLTQWGSQGSENGQFDQLQNVGGSPDGVHIYTSENNVNFRLQKFSYPENSSNMNDIVNNSNSAAPQISIPTAQGCGDFKPEAKAMLFQVDRLPTSATLRFSPVKNSSGYVISYGLGDIVEQFGTSFNWSDNNSGAVSYTIYDLDPKATYSFRVRAQNGCQPGDWGNTQRVKGNTSTEPIIFYP